MFGYFVRRVDKRFQLERQLGLLEEDQGDAVARLERMFSAAGKDEQDPDRPAWSTPPPTPSTSDSSSQASSTTSGPSKGEPSKGEGAGLGKGKKKASPLRKYIESFDQATLADMTRQVVSFSVTQCRIAVPQ